MRRVFLFVVVVVGCAKSVPLTGFPKAEPDAGIVEVAPVARTTLEKALPAGFEITAFEPTGGWEFSRHKSSGLVTERSARAWVGLRNGAQCFVTEVAYWQPQVNGTWEAVKVGLLRLNCNGPDTCSTRFASMGVLASGSSVDVDYYIPGTIGLAARIPCTVAAK